MEIKNVFVAGAGFMGNGIAQMAALAGYSVNMHDVDAERLEAGVAEVKRSLERLLARDRITREQSEATLSNLTTTTALDDARGADIVVEAVPESLELKRDIFARLDGVCAPGAILATNTSAISITSIAAATGRPGRVVGTHFFGPVPVMLLCEIIGGLLTSEETVEQADAWARSLGKDTVIVGRDHAGFIANRVSIPGSCEAVRIVDEGAATPFQTDRAVMFGSEKGVGPLQILDHAGVDVSCNAAMAIYEDTGDPRFYPPPLMRRMVAANVLGRKTGMGFYDYSTGAKDVDNRLILPRMSAAGPRAAALEPGTLMMRVLLPMMLEAVRLIDAGIAPAGDIDKAMRLGFNFPMGPLELADSMGLDEVLGRAESIYGDTGNGNYLAPPLLRRMVRDRMLGRKTGRGFHAYGD